MRITLLTMVYCESDNILVCSACSLISWVALIATANLMAVTWASVSGTIQEPSTMASKACAALS